LGFVWSVGVQMVLIFWRSSNVGIFPTICYHGGLFF
jgi:hypothetical protein